MVYEDLSDYPKALEYYEKSLENKRELGDRQGESRTLSNIGGIYLGLSDYPKALEYYEKALTISRLIGDRFSEAGLTINIGIIYEKYSLN